jgi:thymidylate synthase
VCIGLPNDFAQHALLLHLFCLETNYKAGSVIGMFGQVELYENHIDGAKQLIKNNNLDYPSIETKNFKDIFQWKFDDTNFINYQHGEKIDFIIAI